jgi:hypothetical protein
LTLSFFCIRFYHRSQRKVNITKEKICRGTVIFPCGKGVHDTGAGDALTGRRRAMFKIPYRE